MWDTPSPLPGQGVYDPVRWAVVFKEYQAFARDVRSEFRDTIAGDVRTEVV